MSQVMVTIKQSGVSPINVMVNTGTTIKQVLTDQGIGYSGMEIRLNGSTVSADTQVSGTRVEVRLLKNTEGA